MNDDLNPQAMPFQPSGDINDLPPEHRSRYENPQPPLPFGQPGASWNASFPELPPPPPPFFAGNQYTYSGHDAYLHLHAHEQARAHYNQWSQNYDHASSHSQFQPYGQPTMYPPQQYPQYYQQQSHYQPRQPPYPHSAVRSAMQQANWPQAATNEELQVPAQPSKKSKKAKAKAKAEAKAAASSEDAQKEAPQPAKGAKKGRYGDAKIMLPAPQPTEPYLHQSAQEPSASESPRHILVVLDLNGTVLYRPNRNAQSMIARPYLKSFLRYLFENFKVMVWSSAKPVNVKALVEQSLDKELRSKLVATWARDTFGLSAANFNQNVQVYKNLKLIWSRDQIQQHHPEYAAGERFGQHNTVLIDDSALKANAQPHNLIEIPEFEATPEQMEGDVLREVAGYLDVLRYQADVSKFINKHSFKNNGEWSYDWPVEPVNGSELKVKSVAKNKRPLTDAPLAEVTNSFSTVTLESTKRATQVANICTSSSP